MSESNDCAACSQCGESYRVTSLAGGVCGACIQDRAHDAAVSRSHSVPPAKLLCAVNDCDASATNAVHGADLCAFHYEHGPQAKREDPPSVRDQFVETRASTTEETLRAELARYEREQLDRLRDTFACAALGALTRAMSMRGENARREDVAADCYAMADAMMSERTNRGTK